MMQTLFLILVAILGVGLFTALIRRGPNRRFFPMLIAGVILLGGTGVAMIRLLPIDAAEHGTRVYVALTLLWVGWIGIVALAVQWILRRASGSYPWPVVAGTFATLAPVFGFLVAKALA
ncbi:hypothetical protein [Primorskyibacter flagellatus]|nr:hypothetical protein [Primorskyibacter flagellatus]